MIFFSDINECERPNYNDCRYDCVNTNGSYTCPCPYGMHGDGRKFIGSGCSYLITVNLKSHGNYLYIGQFILIFQMTFTVDLYENS